jgi:DNA-binding cell septation regulator SpoVG
MAENIQVVRMYKTQNSDKGILAYFDVVTAGYRINGFRLVKKVSGEYFIGFPSRQGKDNRWWPVVLPCKEDVLKELEDCLLRAFDDLDMGRMEFGKEMVPPDNESLSESKKLTVDVPFIIDAQVKEKMAKFVSG